jgi:hypothetical protein
MKLYSMDLALYATAYVRATSPEEARKLVQARLINNSIEVPENDLISGARYSWQFKHGNAVTLSPAMTIDHFPNDQIEVAYDPEEQE